MNPFTGLAGGDYRPTVPDDFHASRLAGTVVAPVGADLVLTEVRDPGGGSDPPTFIAPLHTHDRDDEAWYVLEGVLAFRVDQSEVEVPAGGGIVVARGTAHTFWNPSPEPARYLLVMTATIHRLVQALHDPGRNADMGALFRQHHSTLIGWP
jgi:mannose-6-phosphate isomerase-like protein (cupin superfamily)